jgi:SAM-dependent methyltransferase
MSPERQVLEGSSLERHYESFSEGSRLRRSRVRWLEYETTMSRLTAYLPERATILELGAGHGAYALELAALGHTVLATDLLAANVATMRVLIEQRGLSTITVRQADATRLEGIADRSFDAVLCLGPFYHLRTRALRHRCLLECHRVLCGGGFVALSYITRAFALAWLLAHRKALTADQYASLRDPDDLREDYPDPFFNIAHVSTAAAVDAEAQASGLAVVEHAGTDGVFGFFPELLNGLPEAAAEPFRVNHLTTCTESDAYMASFHCLAILRG